MDTDLHVDDTGGSGRPVVLIHGRPLTGFTYDTLTEDLHTCSLGSTYRT